MEQETEGAQPTSETATEPRDARPHAELNEDQRSDRRVIAQLTDELLPVLIARLEASALGELEVRENGWRVRLRRPMHNGSTLDGPRQAAQPATTADADAEGRSTTSPRPERERTQLTSPAVGYFVPRESITPGTSLRGGDLVGHIDVLGVQQEVVVSEDAILARMEVEPGEAVEYDQLIARLEPEARG